jgi:hypothetical protein
MAAPLVGLVLYRCAIGMRGSKSPFSVDGCSVRSVYHFDAQGLFACECDGRDRSVGVRRAALAQ